MIYLDNAATTLHKPPQVEQAILEALHTAGNPGRGAHEPTLHAARIVLDTRLALAELFHAPDPSCIVFAANATMALNTVLNGVLHPGDHVITTVCEHNSVLRPLYRLRAQGVEVSFTGVDNAARLCYDQWETLLHPTTRALVVTGASNVTGNGTDLARAADFAHRHGLLFIVDAAQTAGAQPIDVQRLGIDALCFTGHKALLGPQGTGGAYVRPGLRVAPLLVGGSGVHSFDETHPLQMPTALEAGTLNVHGLAGLCAGVRWLLEQGVESLADRENALAHLFYEQVRTTPGVTVYGDMTMRPRAPIVALNIGQEDSARVADILWEDYGICVRAGAHCAPLMHKALGTAEQGTVQLFPFQYGAGGTAGSAGSLRTCAGDFMRVKRSYIVLSFRTTLEAMEWEKQCNARQVPGRLIPLPREISAGCGLAWRMLPEDWQSWQAELDQTQFDKVTPVEQ